MQTLKIFDIKAYTQLKLGKVRNTLKNFHLASQIIRTNRLTLNEAPLEWNGQRHSMSSNTRRTLDTWNGIFWDSKEALYHHL